MNGMVSAIFVAFILTIVAIAAILFYINPSGNETSTVTAGYGSLTTFYYQQGDGGAYSTTFDSYIERVHPNTAYPFSPSLHSSFINSSMIEFPYIIGSNYGQIPKNSKIQQATLYLGVYSNGGIQYVYQLTQNWFYPNTTWNSFSPPGYPNVASYSAPAGYGGCTARNCFILLNGSTGIAGIDITPIVQNWANGDQNYGILINSTSLYDTVFYSSEYLIHQDRPKLVVSFYPCCFGGSVAADTIITLANRSEIPVQNLKEGMQLLSFDTQHHTYVNTTITRFEIVKVDNLMTISTETGRPLVVDQNPAQKIYVMLPDGSQTTLPVTELKTGYRLFEALSQKWVLVTKIDYQSGGSWNMYDIYNTDPGNYIANGYLDPLKY